MSVHLCNLIIAADAKDFVVIMQFSLFFQIRCLSLDGVSAGSLYSSTVLFLRSEAKHKKYAKNAYIFSICAKYGSKLK